MRPSTTGIFSAEIIRRILFFSSPTTIQADDLCSTSPRWRSIVFSLPHLWCNVVVIIGYFQSYPPPALLEHWLSRSGDQLPLSITIRRENVQSYSGVFQIGYFRHMLAILLRHIHRWESLKVHLEGHDYLARDFVGVSLREAVNLRAVDVRFLANGEYFLMSSIASVPNLQSLVWSLARASGPGVLRGNDLTPRLFPCERLKQVILKWDCRPWEQVAQTFSRCRAAVTASLFSSMRIRDASAFPPRVVLPNLQALYVAFTNLDGMAIFPSLESHLSELTVHLEGSDFTWPRVSDPFGRLIDFIASNRHRLQLFKMTSFLVDIPQNLPMRLLVECRRAGIPSVEIKGLSRDPEYMSDRRCILDALDLVEEDLEEDTYSPFPLQAEGEVDRTSVILGCFHLEISPEFFGTLRLTSFGVAVDSRGCFYQVVRS